MQVCLFRVEVVLACVVLLLLVCRRTLRMRVFIVMSACAVFMVVLRMCAVYVRALSCQMCVCVCWLFASVVVCALACVVLACMLGAELDDAV